MSSNPRDFTLETSDLCCSRGDRRLISDLSFSLRSGEALHIKGHNGSGKTTLLRTLAGLLVAESGEIRWNGHNARQIRQEFQSELLYLGHLNGLKGDLTAVENLRFDAALHGKPLDVDRAWQIFDSIGLRGYEDLPTKYLSQGQKRRVALARLWVSEAALWILDEPFSALDVDAVEALQGVIRQHVEHGGMVIITTHQDVSFTSQEAKVLTIGASDA